MKLSREHAFLLRNSLRHLEGKELTDNLGIIRKVKRVVVAPYHEPSLVQFLDLTKLLNINEEMFLNRFDVNDFTVLFIYEKSSESDLEYQSISGFQNDFEMNNIKIS